MIVTRVSQLTKSARVRKDVISWKWCRVSHRESACKHCPLPSPKSRAPCLHRLLPRRLSTLAAPARPACATRSSQQEPTAVPSLCCGHEGQPTFPRTQMGQPCQIPHCTKLEAPRHVQQTLTEPYFRSGSRHDKAGCLSPPGQM